MSRACSPALGGALAVAHAEMPVRRPDTGRSMVAAFGKLSGFGRTLVVMVEVEELSGWVDRIAEAAVGAADALLREAGALQPPTVHMLSTELSPAYVGYLRSRAFYRGQDAAVAVAALGVLPSALGASRLVLAWEHADLCTALELPGADGFPAGMVVVDAGRTTHTLRWHPMRLHLGPVSGDGVQTVIPEWGAERRFENAALPEPIADLLAVWRRPRDWPESELLKTYTSLEVAGYEMRWITREVDEHAPAWAQLLSPLMG
jgi:hypothetical protein